MSSEDIAAFVGARIPFDERELRILHLAECRECRQIVANIILSEVAVRDVGRHREHISLASSLCD